MDMISLLRQQAREATDEDGKVGTSKHRKGAQSEPVEVAADVGDTGDETPGAEPADTAHRG